MRRSATSLSSFTPCVSFSLLCYQSSLLTCHIQSGTGVLTDDARGEYATDTIYSDLNIEQIKSISPTAVHRHVDLHVINADEQGYARTHIVFPAVIYGIAQHALVDAGVSNAHSVQVPGMIKAALDRKRAGMVGKGKALWPDVHIDDGECCLHMAAPIC